MSKKPTENINQNIKQMKENYLSPSIEVIDVELEGVLCASTTLEAVSSNGIFGDDWND